VLEHIAGDPRHEGAAGVGHISMHGQDDHFGRDASIPEMDGGLDAVERRHGNVGDDDFGVELMSSDKQFSAIGNQAHDLELGFEKSADAFGEDFVIVCGLTPGGR
jgi:hypothetical protein